MKLYALAAQTKIAKKGLDAQKAAKESDATSRRADMDANSKVKHLVEELLEVILSRKINERGLRLHSHCQRHYICRKS